MNVPINSKDRRKYPAFWEYRSEWCSDEVARLCWWHTIVSQNPLSLKNFLSSSVSWLSTSSFLPMGLMFEPLQVRIRPQIMSLQDALKSFFVENLLFRDIR
jgi:hypothetical protein